MEDKVASRVVTRGKWNAIESKKEEEGGGEGVLEAFSPTEQNEIFMEIVTEHENEPL